MTDIDLFFIEETDDDILSVIGHRYPGIKPIGEAPANYAVLRILVDYHGVRFNSRLSNTPRYGWTIGSLKDPIDDSFSDECVLAGWDWCNDCYTEGHGRAIAFLPFF
jgi:hypothetical protein